MATLRAVDCVHRTVPDLAAGLAFYQEALGHELIWRTPVAAGLRLPGSEAELVLSTSHDGPEVDFLVDDVPAVVTRLTAAGATLLFGPADIPVGRVAVLRDPFGNPLSVLDLSKGRYLTAPDGTVTGITSNP